MKTTQHTCLHAMRLAVIAAALLTVCGPKDEAAAQETKKETQKPDSAKTRPGDPKSEQDSAAKTRKASCRCGNLTVTYKGPDPKRITLCHCNSCQLRTGTAFSIQGRFPRANLKIEGKSTKWTFPSDSKKQVCDAGGATYHFCPVCGTTVYWDIAAAPDVIGIAIGTLFDPTFPPPKISGFEKFGHPWAMKAADLPIQRLKLAE
jgi:hypothetical protein